MTALEVAGDSARTTAFDWITPGGLPRIIDEVRKPLYDAKKTAVEIPTSLLRDLQQVALVLHQQQTHHLDVESLQAKVRRLERDIAAVRVDADRKVRQARTREEAALRLAHEAGVTDEQVGEQIEWDRKQAALQARAEDHAQDAHGVAAAVTGLAGRLRTADPDQSIRVATVIAALDAITAGRRAPLLTGLAAPPKSPQATTGQPGLFEETGRA